MTGAAVGGQCARRSSHRPSRQIYWSVDPCAKTGTGAMRVRTGPGSSKSWWAKRLPPNPACHLRFATAEPSDHELSMTTVPLKSPQSADEVAPERSRDQGIPRSYFREPVLSVTVHVDRDSMSTMSRRPTVPRSAP